MPELTRRILSKGVGVRDDDVYEVAGHARPHGPVAARRPRPARPQVAVSRPGGAAASAAARRGRARRRVRPDPRRRPARAPPVRLVHGLRRAVHRAGRRRSRGPHDQADAVSHVGRLADRAEPDPCGRARQAGRGAGRDQGPLRRGGEHRLGTAPRAGGRARGLRPGRAQDAFQGRARRAPRGRRPAPLRAHRDRQLQLQDGPLVCRPRAAVLPRGARRGRHGPVQLADRPVAPARVPAPDRGPDHAPIAVPRAGRAGGAARACRDARDGSSSR